MKVNNGRPSRHRAEILSHFRPGRASSRTQLARATGLSAATISRITRDLVRGNVLTEVARPGAAPGRPSCDLEINGRSGLVLGISLLAPTLRVIVLDLRGDVVRELRAPLDLRGPAGLLQPLRRTVQALSRSNRGLAGVGVALPGQWDPDHGISLTYPRLPEWKNVPIQKQLEDWAGVPATLIGYAPALALAEQARRAGSEPVNLISVEVAENIAMGAIVNGELLQGASGNAGELGHIPIDPDGPICYCGVRGCLETRATCSAVLEEIRGSNAARRTFSPRQSIAYEDVVARARDGDSFCTRLLGRVARSLGTGLATALSLFNPEVLVLNGRFFDAGDLVLEPLRASIREHAIASSLKRLSIEKSTLGPSAPALGAGLSAVREAVRRL